MANIEEELDNQFNDFMNKSVGKMLDERMKNLTIGKDNLSPELVKMLQSMSNTNIATMGNPPTSSVMPQVSGEDKPLVINISLVRKIVSDLLAGNNVYLYGKAGTGKTQIATDIAKILGDKNYNMINCSQWTSPTEIRGGQTITGYKQGTLVKAWEEGNLLILDELPKLDPNTAGLLNEALAKTNVAARPKEYGANDARKFITDGKGDRIKCNEKGGFMVIATGNTDMKTASVEFGGNNRQDYSLVDRFAGSYYLIEFDRETAMKLTYSAAFEVADAIRVYLDKQPNVVENISIRTMLNFSRTYEKEMLARLDSKYADKLNDSLEDSSLGDLKNLGKTLRDSVMSFINTLNPTMRMDIMTKVKINDYLNAAEGGMGTFIQEFEKFYGVDPTA